MSCRFTDFQVGLLDGFSTVFSGGVAPISHSKGSEETLLEFARFYPFHRRFWIPKAYIIEILAKGAWVLGLEGDCVAIRDGFKAIGDGRISKRYRLPTHVRAAGAFSPSTFATPPR